MNARSAADILRRMTKPKEGKEGKAHKAAAYFAVHIAWLDCADADRTRRLAQIQRAARGEATAAAELAKVTEAWQARHGRRTRFAGVLKSHIDTIGNGCHEVWGDRRTAWHRFASYVALRAVTSRSDRAATRASYAQIAALALGFPTIAAAMEAGHDLTPNRAMYRRTQRAVRACAAAGLVMQWRQKGFRSCWYSYRVSTPDVPRAIAEQQAANKRNLRAVRELIAETATPPRRIEPSQAAAIYTDVRALGWHDVDLITLPRESYAHAVTATERIGGRQYVRLTRGTATEFQTARAGLHNAIGRHVLSRCGT